MKSSLFFSPFVLLAAFSMESSAEPSDRADRLTPAVRDASQLVGQALLNGRKQERQRIAMDVSEDRQDLALLRQRLIEIRDELSTPNVMDPGSMVINGTAQSASATRRASGLPSPEETRLVKVRDSATSASTLARDMRLKDRGSRRSGQALAAKLQKVENGLAELETGSRTERLTKVEALLEMTRPKRLQRPASSEDSTPTLTTNLTHR